jgi:hypothetical protein
MFQPEMIMSMTGNENQPTQAAPQPTEEELDRTTSEAEQTEPVRTLSPGMATHPTIKNN